MNPPIPARLHPVGCPQARHETRRVLRLSSLGAVSVGLIFLARTAFAEPLRWDTKASVAGYHDSDHVTVLTPTLEASVREPTGGLSAEGSYLVDIVSAASVDIVSAASPRWNEVRHAGTLAVGYKPGSWGGSVHAATSIEPDYRSLAGGINGVYELSRKNVTLSVGYTYEHDIAGRTGTPFSVYGLRLDRHELGAGLEIVMDRATTLTPTLDVRLESGRQEKPYRWLPLFDQSVASSVPVGASVDLVNQLRQTGRIDEHLPDTRQRYAGSARLAHRFQSSTLALWDRAYLDSWGLLASTTSVRWVLDLSRRWSLSQEARFHVQSGVSFWKRAYVGSFADGRAVVPEFRSGDRELGPLWSASLGPGLRFDMGGDDPQSMSVSLEIQGIYTDFRDTLYIDHRWAGFGVAGFSARFP